LVSKRKISLLIEEIFKESKSTYGSPRIYQELISKGIYISENTVAKYMAELNFKASQKRQFKVQTTDSNHVDPIAPRLFKVESEHALPTGPGQVLVGDITYLRVGPNAQIIFLSDRGAQYASEAYRNFLKNKNITPSMSRRGNCYDNAYVESWFASLKKEWIYRHKYSTEAELRELVFEYIETWYNKRRRHSSLGYLSPEMYQQAIRPA
jgi:transposase InsO family protein